jgi:hypothetical protein
VTAQEKSTRDYKVKPPPYLSNGDRLRKYFCTIRFKTFENGGVGHLQIPKKNSKLGQKCPYNPKTPNLQYPPNLTVLSKNNTTISFRTHEKGGVGHLETFKFINI